MTEGREWPAPTIGRPDRVLVVCTANQARSPMAAALLARALADARLPAVVGSAGVLAANGAPPTRDAIRALAERRGLDLSGHRSQLLVAESIANADLVFGMAREHVREVIALEPSAWDRAFTLKELVRRGAAHPRQRELLRQWLADLAAGRSVEDLLGASPTDDDLADPVGQPREVYRQTVDDIDDLVERLVRIAWPGHGDWRMTPDR